MLLEVSVHAVSQVKMAWVANPQCTAATLHCQCTACSVGLSELHAAAPAPCDTLGGMPMSQHSMRVVVLLGSFPSLTT
jgi:hypothetical protein